MSIKVTRLIDTFDLKVINKGHEDAEIKAADSNRCGLQLTGFYREFERLRIQVIGNAESEYLQTLNKRIYNKAMSNIISMEVPCIILTNGNSLSDEAIQMAKDKNRWILGTDKSTSRYLIDQTIFLQHQLAENIVLHGVLVDVYGVGVLITGDSGVGKSETAIDLIRKGHMLVADDAVSIKKVNSHLLMGTSNELTRNLIECRGIGIVNVNSLFGKSAIRLESPVELVMNLVKWDDSVDYNRIQGDFTTKNIMGIEIPEALIPVKPGRNIAAIIEIGALDYRQNQMGYNTANELNIAIKQLNR